ncbi:MULTISPECIES: hypothetical protein [unclassified Rathayibacter]|uniref:hypothetical protein n=1 Tax=unclassified Rathayibacter TaxID=2609250 RepID=UPI0010E7FDD6|nr:MULTISPECIES: hypothetical protein [unclassified Rathayibacter]TCL80169.1 hypothetical protein EDF49_110115 [Rathayibacter sp. PhB192]TCM25610.1 hypothetical protein EDF43_110115 [Rathayibacter sp. PhB179]
MEALTLTAGDLVVSIAILFLVRSIVTLHPVDGYGAGILFAIGLGLLSDRSTSHIDLGEGRSDRIRS